MPKLVTNPQKPVVRVKTSPTNYRKVFFLAQSVHDLMLTNVAIFPLPLPTSANFQTDITTLGTALASLGTKSNRGSVASLNAVKAAAFTVFAELTQRAGYVQETVDASTSPADQAVIISASGFATKSKRSKITPMQFAKKVRQTNNKQFPQTLRRINWFKPLGTFTGVRPKAYNIYALNGSGPAALSSFLTSTTKGNILVPATALFAGVSHPITAIEIKPITPTGEGNGFRIDVK